MDYEVKRSFINSSFIVFYTSYDLIMRQMKNIKKCKNGKKTFGILYLRKNKIICQLLFSLLAPQKEENYYNKHTFKKIYLCSIKFLFK